jgi:tetratricopeptide (TPR) repeat protein
MVQRRLIDMKGYTLQDVVRLLDLPEHRIRAYIRAGFIAPERGDRNEYLFSFQDLVLLRTAAELSREQVPQRRITDALARLRNRLPVGRSLSEVRIRADGADVVVRERDEPPWNPQSGQFHMEFEVAELAERAAPIARVIAQRAHAAATERSAAEWFELGVELEAVEPDEARAAYGRALERDAEHADARVNLARLLHEAGQAAEAEAEYRRVLQRGEHALAAYNLALLLEDMGRTTDAMREYARAIASDPELAEAHYNLARLYEQRGDRPAAIRHFNGYRELMRGRE